MRKAIFGLFLTDIHNTYILSTQSTHTTNEQISKRKSFVCMKFISSFVRFSVYFFIFSKKKIKKKTIICDLFDRYGQWKTALNRRLIAMNSVFSFHWFWAFEAVHLFFFFHPGRMADLPFLHCIRNMNDLGVNSILRHFTKDPISASTTDFDFLQFFFLLFYHFTLRSLNCHAKISENLSLLRSENIIHAKTIAVCCVWLPGTNFNSGIQNRANAIENRWSDRAMFDPKRLQIS